MTNPNRTIRRLAYLATSIGLGTGLAIAQSAPASTQNQTEEEQDNAAPARLERVEVTGSRIKRVDVEGPSPIRVVNNQEIRISGRQTLTDVLRDLPEVGAIAINEGGTITAVRGATAINLRGLGANNTLILVNGRRTTVSGTNSGGTTFVDLGRIPAAMIERIEVVKDGASAIYGADATAGVVNVILRKDFTGVEFNASYGQYEQGDGIEKAFSFFGGASTGKARATLAFSYVNRDPVRAADRDFSADADKSKVTGDPNWDLRSPTGNQARIAGVRAGQSQGAIPTPGPGYAAGSAINIPGVAAGATINRLPGTTGGAAGGVPVGGLSSASPNFLNPPQTGTNGSFNASNAATFVPQILSAGSNPPSTNLFNFQPFVWLVPKTERTSINASFNYEFTPTIEGFAEVFYNKNISETQLAPSPISTAGDNNIYVPRYNFWNPFGVDVNFNYRPTEVGPRIATITSDTYGMLGGLRGRIADRFDWEAAASYSKDDNRDTTRNAVSESRLRAALGRTDSSALNIFGGQGFRNNPATLESIKVQSFRAGSADLTLFDAKVTGDVIDWWGGTIAAAIYAEHRDENFEEANDSLSTALDDIIGQVRLADPTKANRRITSFAGELSVPLIKKDEIPLIEDLTLSIAARHERFSDRFGKNTKPKVGVTYKPYRDLILRGSWGEGFRAPSLPQLYGGVRESLPNGLPDPRRPQALTGDFDDGAAFQRLVRAGGNVNLNAEESTNWQVGGVWEVYGVRGLEVAATRFHFEQENIITTTGAGFTLNNELNGFQDRVTRVPGTQTFTNTTANPINVYTGPGPAGSAGATTVVPPGGTITVPGKIQSISDSFANQALVTTEGWDLEVRYRRNFDTLGQFNAGVSGTYLESYEQIARPGSAPFEFVDTDGFPRFRLGGSLFWEKDFDFGILGAGVTTAYTAGYELPFFTTLRRKVRPYVTWDTSVSYEFNQTFLAGTVLRVGVQNVFDRDPSLYYDAVGYDQRFVGRPGGRFWFTSMTMRF